DAIHDFVSDERVVWVNIKGILLNVWSREMFMKIEKIWGETMDIEDNLDSSFSHKRLCIKTKHADSILEKFKVIFRGKVFMVRPIHSDEDSGDDSDVDGVHDSIFGDNSSSPINCNGEIGEQNSEDPFRIYDLLKKQATGGGSESSPSLSHPPGFTLVVSEIHKEIDPVEVGIDSGVENLWLMQRGAGMLTWLRMSKLEGVLLRDPHPFLLPQMSKLDGFMFHNSRVKSSIKNELSSIDKDLDRGIVSDAALLKRLELMRQLQDINQMEARDSIQKSKIK
ncbi:hypothetical protein Tco_0251985, partial [Tanacetum coccineum]